MEVTALGPAQHLGEVEALVVQLPPPLFDLELAQAPGDDPLDTRPRLVQRASRVAPLVGRK